MHYMNPQRGRHMAGMGEKPAHSEGHKDGKAKPHPHSIHIHHAGDGEPHPDNAHRVHVHHADGSHEDSDHGSFQEAMDHVHSIGGEDGQDHGYSAGEDMEDEDSLGGPAV